VQHIGEAVVREATQLGDGTLGVVVPAESIDELGRALAAAVPELSIGEQPEPGARVTMLTVRQAKGLEFDAVVVVDPERMLAESARGHSDLYVALTRATQRLGVLHPAELPPVLGALTG
jgi:superfamily I DNA/RNA helicase